MVLESEQEKIGCYLLRIVALLLGYHHFIYYLYDNQAFVVMHGNALLMQYHYQGPPFLLQFFM